MLDSQLSAELVASEEESKAKLAQHFAAAEQHEAREKQQDERLAAGETKLAEEIALLAGHASPSSAHAVEGSTGSQSVLRGNIAAVQHQWLDSQLSEELAALEEKSKAKLARHFAAAEQHRAKEKQQDERLAAGEAELAEDLALLEGHASASIAHPIESGVNRNGLVRLQHGLHVHMKQIFATELITQERIHQHLAVADWHHARVEERDARRGAVEAKLAAEIASMEERKAKGEEALMWASTAQAAHKADIEAEHTLSRAKLTWEESVMSYLPFHRLTFHRTYTRPPSKSDKLLQGDVQLQSFPHTPQAGQEVQVYASERSTPAMLVSGIHRNHPNEHEGATVRKLSGGSMFSDIYFLVPAGICLAVLALLMPSSFVLSKYARFASHVDLEAATQ